MSLKKRIVRGSAQVGAVLLGAGFIGWLVHHVGPDALWHAFRHSAKWLPLLLSLEALQIVLEAFATRELIHECDAEVPFSRTLRIQLMGYPLINTLPAGRTASELLKAALFLRYMPRAKAIAVASAAQALSLVGNSLVALLCLIPVWLDTNSSTLIVGLVIFFCASFGIGAVILTARRTAASSWIRKLLPKKFEQGAKAFHEVVRDQSHIPWKALGAYFIERGLQIAQFGIILHAVGGPTGLSQAAIAGGIYFVGVGAGDLIPGNLGTTEGAFAYFSKFLSLTAAQGVAVSLIIRLVQVIWVAFAASLFWLWPLKNTAATPNAHVGLDKPEESAK